MRYKDKLSKSVVFLQIFKYENYIRYELTKLREKNWISFYFELLILIFLSHIKLYELGLMKVSG